MVPKHPILEIDCSTNVACVVNAGDDFYVVTIGANSLKQYVFVEDITQGWGGLFELDYVSGPSLVGSRLWSGLPLIATKPRVWAP